MSEPDLAASGFKVSELVRRYDVRRPRAALRGAGAEIKHKDNTLTIDKPFRACPQRSAGFRRHSPDCLAERPDRRAAPLIECAALAMPHAAVRRLRLRESVARLDGALSAGVRPRSSCRRRIVPLAHEDSLGTRLRITVIPYSRKQLFVFRLTHSTSDYPCLSMSGLLDPSPCSTSASLDGCARNGEVATTQFDRLDTEDALRCRA
jgi:hypothetical protein